MKKILTLFMAFSALISLVSCSEEEDYSVVGGIYGAVTDIDTKQPIQGANIVLSPTNVSTTTGADGTFVFENLESKQYKLSVTAGGYSYNSRQVNVIAGQDVSGDISLTATTTEE